MFSIRAQSCPNQINESVIIFYTLRRQKCTNLRALIVSDIHSNLEAFQSVIEDVESRGGFDQIWSLGDLVGYGPDPVACVDLLRSYSHQAVAGNHDLASIGKLSLEAFNSHAKAANEWTATQLGREQAEYIAGQQLKLELDEFTVVHGSPRDPVWEYVITVSAAVASFMHFDTYWCLVGHSHIPFMCHPSEEGATFANFPGDTPVILGEDRIIINPGSVGQPRDGDPRASYLVFDESASSIVHHRVAYDIPSTQEKMTKVGLPKFLIDRLAVGR